jgi:hypothetical protein
MALIYKVFFPHIRVGNTTRNVLRTISTAGLEYSFKGLRKEVLCVGKNR